MIHRNNLLTGLILVLLAQGAAAVAQEDRITLHDIPRNAEYDSGNRFSGLQSRLNYIDELTGEIPMDGVPDYKPPEPEDDGADNTTTRQRIGQGLLLLFAIGLGFVMLRHAGPFLRRFGLLRELPGAAMNGRTQPDDGTGVPLPGLIERLRGMDDTETALVMLVGALLPVAADQNGLRIRRSETARELLRRLPAQWTHLASLRRIVMTEELVQFGGRPLTRRAFEDCLDRARQILGTPA